MVLAYRRACRERVAARSEAEGKKRRTSRAGCPSTTSSSSLRRKCYNSSGSSNPPTAASTTAQTPSHLTRGPRAIPHLVLPAMADL